MSDINVQGTFINYRSRTIEYLQAYSTFVFRIIYTYVLFIFIEILRDKKDNDDDEDQDDEDEDVLINVNIADNEVAKERVELSKKKTPGYRAYHEEESADQFGMVCFLSFS